MDELRWKGRMTKMALGEYPLVTNIQRFSLHDGPGIRTTIFMKGCSLCCPWCSNPENISGFQQKYFKDDVSGTYGKYLSCDEIYAEVMKDRVFYGEYFGKTVPAITAEQLEQLPGGVTFSGGEALLQAERLEPLFKALKEGNIYMAVETGLFVPLESVRIAIKYISLFYIDIKILDEDKCRNILGGNLSLYFNNLNYVFEKEIPVIFRIPIIGGYTDETENQKKVLGLLKRYRPIKVELIKGHNLGAPKYVSLNLKEPDYKEASDEFLERYQSEIEELGVVTEICKI